MTEFRLYRSKRKTIAITVSGGQVTVRAPVHTSEQAIADFVRSKEQWITEKRQEQQARNTRFAPYLRYEQYAYMGRTLDPTRVPTGKIRIEGDCLCIPEKYAEGSERKYIANLYKRQADTMLRERLTGLAQEYGFTYTAFRLTNARGKWGSCTAENEIRLNWRLLFFEWPIVDYVIVHELCHTVFHDHSKRFWLLVEKYCPAYRQIKKELQKRSVFTELFR